MVLYVIVIQLIDISNCNILSINYILVCLHRTEQNNSTIKVIFSYGVSFMFSSAAFCKKKLIDTTVFSDFDLLKLEIILVFFQA